MPVPRSRRAAGQGRAGAGALHAGPGRAKSPPCLPGSGLWLIAAGLAVGVLLACRRYRAGRRRQRQLADLAHELRTPLAGMTGMLELLAATALDRQQRRQLGAIQQAGRRLARLIDGGLEAMLSQAAATGLRPGPFAPETLCRQIMELMRPLAEAKGLQLQFVTEERLPDLLVGDALRVEQVLLNVLGNAVKYTAVGRIRLSTAWRQDQWWLWVRDTGPGMAEQHRQRAFRRFQRLPATASLPGQGLGLAIAQDWVGRMGGSITLQQAWEGVGTAVCIRLPLPEACGQRPVA